jgi:hypothetical protein
MSAAASIAVGHHAEDERTDGTHGERRRDGQNDVALGNVEVGGQRVEEEDDDEEVEGVERPAEKASAHRVPAVGVCLHFPAGEVRHPAPPVELQRS